MQGFIQLALYVGTFSGAPDAKRGRTRRCRCSVDGQSGPGPRADTRTPPLLADPIRRPIPPPCRGPQQGQSTSRPSCCQNRPQEHAETEMYQCIAKGKRPRGADAGRTAPDGPPQPGARRLQPGAQAARQKTKPGPHDAARAQRRQGTRKRHSRNHSANARQPMPRRKGRPAGGGLHEMREKTGTWKPGSPEDLRTERPIRLLQHVVISIFPS